jgi:hypothetical protein
MSKDVRLADLARQLDVYGPLATVVTVSAEAIPHVGTSLVELDGDRVVVRVGPTAAGQLEANPALCLTWPPPAGNDYQLIVDASAVEVRPDGDTFTVVADARSGIRHSVATAPKTGPSCIALDEGVGG